MIVSLEELELSPVFSKLVDTISLSKNITVILGAGVSVSAGIPDFRSSDGLYTKIESKYPGLLKKGQHLFDASVLHSHSNSQAMRSAYFMFMAELKQMCMNARPTKTHNFLKWLYDCGKLRRIYSQNIDGLEEKSGLIPKITSKKNTIKKQSADKSISEPLTISLHGTLDSLSCTICSYQESFTQHSHIATFLKGDILDCPLCKDRLQKRKDQGKRSLSTGILTPSILLYNDHTTANLSIPFTCGHKMSILCEEIGQWMAIDSQSHNLPDILIVFGTSCKVTGIKKWIKTLASRMHQQNEQSKTDSPANNINRSHQSKLTNYYKQSRSSPNFKDLTTQLQYHKILDVHKHKLVIYCNRTPLKQKEWSKIFDLQIISDCDDIVSLIQNTIKCEKENKDSQS